MGGAVKEGTRVIRRSRHGEPARSVGGAHSEPPPSGNVLLLDAGSDRHVEALSDELANSVLGGPGRGSAAARKDLENAKVGEVCNGGIPVGCGVQRAVVDKPFRAAEGQ